MKKIDPAVGRSRAQRAMGEFYTGNGDENIRMINDGPYSGPRGSFGRYNVSKNAKDALNKGRRNRGER
jgi:hypothetical protein